MPEFKTNYVADPVSFGAMGREIGASISKSLFTIAELKRKEQQEEKERQQKVNSAFKLDEAKSAVIPAGVIPRYKGLAQEALNDFQEKGAMLELEDTPENRSAFMTAKQNLVEVSGQAVALSKQAQDMSLQMRQGTYKGSAISLEEASSNLNAWMNDVQTDVSVLTAEDLYIPPTMGETAAYMPQAYAKSRYEVQFNGNQQYYGQYSTGHFDGTIKYDELLPNMEQRFKNAMAENPAVSNLATSQFAYRMFDQSQAETLTDTQLNQTAPSLYRAQDNLAMTDFTLSVTDGGAIELKFKEEDEGMSPEQKQWRKAYKAYAESYLNTQHDLLKNGVRDQTAAYEAAQRAQESAERSAQQNIVGGAVYREQLPSGRTELNEKEEVVPVMDNYYAGVATIDGRAVSTTRGGARHIVSDFLFNTNSEGEIVISKIRLQKPQGGFDFSQLDGEEGIDIEQLLSSTKFEEVIIDRGSEEYDKIYNDFISQKKGKLDGRTALALLMQQAEGMLAQDDAPQAEAELSGESQAAEQEVESVASDAASAVAGEDGMLYGEMLTYFISLEPDAIDMEMKRLEQKLAQARERSPNLEWTIKFNAGRPVVAMK